MEIWKKLSCRKSKKLPVKVTDEKRSRKIGLIVSSLVDLKKRSNDLLSVVTGSKNWDSLYIGLEDGTEVSNDDYLFSLKNNTLLIIYKAKPVQQDKKIHATGMSLLKTRKACYFMSFQNHKNRNITRSNGEISKSCSRSPNFQLRRSSKIY